MKREESDQRGERTVYYAGVSGHVPVNPESQQRRSWAPHTS